MPLNVALEVALKVEFPFAILALEVTRFVDDLMLLRRYLGVKTLIADIAPKLISLFPVSMRFLS